MYYFTHPRLLALSSTIATILLLVSLTLGAQESDHNRLAVRADYPWQSNLGVEASILPIVYGDNQTIFYLQPQADILLNNRWYTAFSLPVYVQLPLTIQDTVPCAIAQGDINLNGAWISQTNQGQHRVSLNWTIPTGLSKALAEAHDSIPTGGTLHRFDLSWHYTRYTDPVSLTVGVNLGSTIPGTLDDKPYWEPASAGLSLGATLLMNRWVALQCNLSQSLSLPPRSENQWRSDYIQYDARLSCSLWYTEQNNTFSIELSKNMANPLEGLGIAMQYLYSFKPKKR
ncbi:hypothetical protein Spica_0263 [Gracilinema caldarium DSM 7334]|uniref:Uncharacterized protein n=2 Tax=Gracilinema caldarium TaxID=215591 RepID=F8EYJ8_GRAC1|nr:hypothetical protein Spica_0263 [Gracilinema caldarium DSM 7334]